VLKARNEGVVPFTHVSFIDKLMWQPWVTSVKTGGKLGVKELQQRAEAKDAKLDVDLKVTKINKGILELAKSTLPQVLGAVSTEPQSSRHAEGPATVSTLLLKQEASLRAMRGKRSQAQKEMAKQNLSFLDRRSHVLDMSAGRLSRP
jgi:hypothetical protein